MKFFNLIIIFFFLTLNIEAQEAPILKKYHELIFKAKKHTPVHLDSSYYYYEQALNIYSYPFFYSDHLINAGLVSLKLNLIEDAFTKFRKSVSNGGETIYQIEDKIALGYTQYDSLFKSNEWSLFKKGYDSLINIYMSNIDLNLYKVVKRMFDKDQHIRKTTKGWNEDIVFIDSLNWLIIDSIIYKSRNIPGLQSIGARGAYYFSILLNHSCYCSEELYDKWYPIIKGSIYTGDLRPYSFALWVDRRRRVITKKPQIFGAYCKSSGELPIMIEGYDVKRDEIFLPKFKDWHQLYIIAN